MGIGDRGIKKGETRRQEKNYTRLEKPEEEELVRKSLQLSVHLCMIFMVL